MDCFKVVAPASDASLKHIKSIDYNITSLNLIQCDESRVSLTEKTNAPGHIEPVSFTGRNFLMGKSFENHQFKVL
jgi:hypothetical protein